MSSNHDLRAFLRRSLKDDGAQEAVKRIADRITDASRQIIIDEGIIDTGQLLASADTVKIPNGYASELSREGLQYLEHGHMVGKDENQRWVPGRHIMPRAIQRAKIQE